MEPTINIALRAARKAGELIIRAQEQLDRLVVENKSINDFVSEVDRSAEQEILFHLKKAFPRHGYRCEESGYTPGTGDGADYEWVIDPLDGTTNYLRGIPHFAVSIACKYRGKLEHAVVLDPVRGEEFTASRGKGAALNGRRIRVSAQKSLEGALLGTGIPFRTSHMARLDAYTDTLNAFARANTAGIRRAGSASLDLAYVAAGRFDAFWEIELNEWDWAAGALLVTEAGGLISDMDGGNNYAARGDLVCGTPKVFKAVLQIVKPRLGTQA